MKREQITRRFDDIVAFAEVEQFLDTPVKRYSSGMYVRLAFAVAAHLEPEILIVDEVLAVGDTEFQKKCLGKMGDVARHGRTVLFVSHNAQAVQRLTTRCVYLKEGRKFADGPATEILSLYGKEGAKRMEKGVFESEMKIPKNNRLACAEVITSGADSVHQSGAPIEFEFVIDVVAPSPSICFSFQLLNSDGLAVCHFSSHNPGAGWGHRCGQYQLTCKIPKCRLFMGTYSLTVWLADRRINELSETRSGLCEFNVEMKANGNAQYDWNKGECIYIEECIWGASV